MEFIVVGSGGFVDIPKPLCQCEVCVEAREKGYPYERCSCSLYLKDCNILVDTPEDISKAINHANITAIDTILYTHWDPDHTLGMRVLEQLRLEILEYSFDDPINNPIQVLAQPRVMEDLLAIQNKFGSYLGYYESLGIATLKTIEEPIVQNGITITPVSVPTEEHTTVFVFEENGKKLIYAPCDCKPFPEDDIFYNADILVVGNTYISGMFKNGIQLAEESSTYQELHSLEDILALQKHFQIKEVVVTHLEEFFGRSYDDYLVLEQGYDNLTFAYDGMKIIV